MATWLEKLRKANERTKEQEKLAREMTHRPQADIETLRGQDPLTDWGLGVRERTLSPLSTLASEAKRFQGLSPQEMGMELVGGGMAGTIKKTIGKVAKTKFEKAHELAQRNAALPVEQGGLGLPSSNTAMDRAKAMGFDDKTYYHGTQNDITKFDPKKSAQGGITWIADNPQYSADYALQSGGNIIPLMANMGKTAGWKEYDQLVLDELSGRGYNSAWLPEAQGESVGFVMNPNQLRSKFAAFDPKKAKSSNILAGTAMGGVGLSALAGNQDEYY